MVFKNKKLKNHRRLILIITLIILIIGSVSIFLFINITHLIDVKNFNYTLEKEYSLHDLRQLISPLDIDQEKILHDHKNWQVLTDFEEEHFFIEEETGIMSYDNSVVISGNRSIFIDIPTSETIVVSTKNSNYCFDPRKHTFRISIYLDSNPDNLGYVNSIYFKTNNDSYYIFDIPVDDLKKNEWVEVVCNRWYQVGNPNPNIISSFQVHFSAQDENHVKLYLDKLEILNPIFKEGAITLTFDDAQISHFTKIFSLMKQYNFRGVEGFTHSFYDMTDIQLKEMQNYGWDIVNHGWNHIKQTANSKDDIEYDILRMMMYLKDKDFNGWRYFIAPYGEMFYYDLMSSYCIFSRGLYYTNNEGANMIPPTNSFLNCKMIVNSTSVDEIKNLINNTIERGEWLILLWHGLDDDGYEPWPLSNFKEILNFIKIKDIQVITFTDAWNVIYQP
jgi:peptidoglycan/xylan/chitin deacetylase (PgdA/CDA1 family)